MSADNGLRDKILSLVNAAVSVANHLNGEKARALTGALPSRPSKPSKPTAYTRGKPVAKAEPRKQGRPIDPNSRRQRALAMFRAGASVPEVVKATGLTRSYAYMLYKEA